MNTKIEGNIVSIDNREIFTGSIEIKDGIIVAINRHATSEKSYIMSGFIDAHVHIESSMLTPQNFGYLAIKQGSVAVVTDPHEIANVLGVEGVNFMVENSLKSPIKTFFTIPSSVPATPFDISGGVIDTCDVEQLASTGRFVALSEMMNVPGVLFGDSEVLEKLAIAKRYNLKIDGHAPLLSGDDLDRYIQSGISTDHEVTSIEEAIEKISKGMKIVIREGSAARNFDSLKSLIKLYPDDIMFCSDDSHPDAIIKLGHIRNHVRRALNEGYDLFDVIKIASINPIRHYGLDVGELRVGDSADFIVVNNLENLDVERVFINGLDRLSDSYPTSSDIELNNFNHKRIDPKSLKREVSGSIKVISLIDGEIITRCQEYTPTAPTNNLESDLASDITKIVYLNRYTDGEPQVAYCRGFTLQKGAFASSVAHDSHNILSVGCNDNDIAAAINAVIDNKGGLSVSCGGETSTLALPIGGIMSSLRGEEVAKSYHHIDRDVKDLGCRLDAPFMTLSFLSLVVIPELKIGEKGLFSYSKFSWVNIDN